MIEIRSYFSVVFIFHKDLSNYSRQGVDPGIFKKGGGGNVANLLRYPH